MFSIDNFSSHINKTILQRGKQYYDHGNVTYLEQTGSNTWAAEVEGSDTYTVSVKLKKNKEITNYDCDCPFEGDICKHVVAVFFALQQDIPLISEKGHISKKDQFEHLLQKITIKEYQQFVRSHASGNRQFKTAFEIYFAGKDNQVNVAKKYRELIQKLIRKYSNGSYVDYRAAFDLSKEINSLLKSSEQIDKHNAGNTFMLAKSILRPVMETIEYSDDSGGLIGDSIDRIIHILETISLSSAVTIDIKEQLLKYLQEELNRKIYFDYGNFGYSLFSIFQHLCVQLNKPELFLNFIDAQISKLTGEYDRHLTEFLQKNKILFLQQTGRQEEANKLVMQNMHIVEVRLAEVNKSVEKRDFKAAKKLIEEGIKIAQAKDYPGIVDQWQKELLRIAVLEKDIGTIRHYARYFAFTRGFSPAYYRQWKATFTATEWRLEIEKHIEKTILEVEKTWKGRQNTFWNSTHLALLGHLAPIYIEEKYWDRLLQLVTQANSLHAILEYHTWLIKQYPEELLSLYVLALKQHGIKATGRGEYEKLAAIMKKVIKDIPQGKEKILEVARELINQFSSKPRRPALIEELGKIL